MGCVAIRWSVPWESPLKIYCCNTFSNAFICIYNDSQFQRFALKQLGFFKGEDIVFPGALFAVLHLLG
jgi:hypothetical protein